MIATDKPPAKPAAPKARGDVVVGRAARLHCCDSVLAQARCGALGHQQLHRSQCSNGVVMQAAVRRAATSCSLHSELHDCTVAVGDENATRPQRSMRAPAVA